MDFPNIVSVQAPSNNSLNDGVYPVPLAGKHAEQLVADLHGKWYTGAYRGHVFLGTTALAGTIIPINASGLASTFTFWNPAGSGVNAELISYDAGMNSATLVVAAIALVYQANVPAAIAAPGTLTQLATVTGGSLGSTTGVQASRCGLYSAATHVGTPTTLMALGSVSATSGALPGLHYEFDGKLIIPPGVVVSTVSVAAQSAAWMQSLSWAEWPV